jgi:hypothetical protein
MMGALPKPARGTARLERRERRQEARTKEDKEKAAARRRDGRCRFPLCGCKRFGYALHVSHFVHHKGIGGDPSGERSDRRWLIQLCIARHLGNKIAIDRGTLDCRPVVPELGAEGPVAWYVDAAAIGRIELEDDYGWYLLATENAVGQLEPLNPIQREILTMLASMRA